MENWINLALEEAQQAALESEVPVGAVAVLDGRLIARNHNRSVQLRDPTAHAEILVLRSAGEAQANYRLNGLEIYVTLEPCSMCCGALIWSRVSRLVFGARDEKAGAVYSRVSLLRPGLFNHNVEVVEGVLADHCSRILQRFFEGRRKKPGHEEVP